MTAVRRVCAAVAMATFAVVTAACTTDPAPSPTPTPTSTASGSTSSAPSGSTNSGSTTPDSANPTAGAPSAAPGTGAVVDAAVNCAGPLPMPDLTGLPVVSPTESAEITEASGAVYRVTVGLDEESQHPDLPADSPEEVLMFPVTIAVTAGTLDHADAFSFQVYDSVSALNCVLGEDPIGYLPILATSLDAGQDVHGFMGFKVPKATSRFTIVYFVDGSAAAAWR